MLLSDITNTINSTGLTLHEVLTGDQYKELFKEAGFGFELEVVCKDVPNFKRGINKVIDKLRSYGSSFLDTYKDFTSNITLRKCLDKMSSNYDVLIAFFCTMKMLRKAKYPIFKELALEFENGSGITGSFKALDDFLERINNVFISFGHGVTGSKEWRIENDPTLEDSSGDNSYTMEFITPLGAAEKGLNYEQCLNQLPPIVKCLKALRLVGNSSTGLHINISVGDKLNATAIRTFINNLRVKGYSSFAIACLIGTRESEGLFQKGSYERRSNDWSPDFIPLVERSISRIILRDFIRRSVISKLDNSTDYNEIQLPIIKFMNKDDIADTYFKSAFDDYLYAVTSAKAIALAGRHNNRVELRGFGGAKGLDQLLNSNTLGQVIRLALAQLYPFINPDIINKKDIMRSTELGLREIIVPLLTKLIKDKDADLFRDTKTQKIVGFTADYVNDIKLVKVKFRDGHKDYNFSELSKLREFYIKQLKNANAKTPEDIKRVQDSLISTYEDTGLTKEQINLIFDTKKGIKGTNQSFTTYLKDSNDIKPNLPEDIVMEDSYMELKPEGWIPTGFPVNDLLSLNSRDKFLILGKKNPQMFLINEIKKITISNRIAEFTYMDSRTRNRIEFKTPMDAKRFYDIVLQNSENSNQAKGNQAELNRTIRREGAFNYSWIS